MARRIAASSSAEPITHGTGSVAPDWKPRPGNWRAVLMNAGGTRGVAAAAAALLYRAARA